MYPILNQVCVILFLSLPPFLLGMKLITGRPAWWLLLLTVAIVGWASWFGTFYFYQLNISELISSGAELPEGWDSDGAAGVFALLLGWLIALSYLLPWFVIYIFITLIRKIFQGMKKT